MTTNTEETRTWPIVPKAEMLLFMEKCMATAGTKPEHAKLLAEVLMSGDSRGHYSHGLNRLDMYVKDIASGITVKDKEPEVLKDFGATAWVDGNNCLGPVVGKYCMDIAIKKAKEVGIGWVIAKGSNHFGIAGWYSMRAAENGFLGMAFTNTSPFLVPTRSRTHGLGTNPLSLAANGKGDDSFVLDMATTSVAQGKLEIAHRRGDPIPDGWGCDSKGRQSNDAGEILGDGGCLPLGGMEQNSGYKGYGLAMMVEIFCGILGGASFGPNVRMWKTRERVADLGQCFIAINPECFAPGFDGRLSSLIHTMKGLDLAEGETEILVPGDPEKKMVQECERRGGIPYHPNQIKYIVDLSKEFNVELPPSVSAMKK